MKSALTSVPILQFPDFKQPFILTTDDSDFAIGAVLSQGKLGHDLPVAYGSHLLTKEERNHSATERERVFGSCRIRPTFQALSLWAEIFSSHRPPGIEMASLSKRPIFAPYALEVKTSRSSL